MDDAALAEQAECCLLGPEMVQLFFEPVACTCDPALSVLKDILLLAGQRACPFQTLLTYRCFFPSLVFLRRGLLPGTEVKDRSTQEVATFGSQQDLAGLELWVMSSPVPRCEQRISRGSWRSRRWQSTWGWWGQLGFLSAGTFQLWCLQTPRWGADGSEVLSCARQSRGECS